MSFIGYLEVFIQFHSIRNIDLFHQGLYQLRTHVYRETSTVGQLVAGEPTRISCNPIEVLSNERERRLSANTVASNPHCVAQSFVNEDNKSFTTRTFKIRFCEEEVELNDGIVFRFEIDLANPDSYVNPLYIETSLRFADVKKQSSSDNHNSNKQTSKAHEHGKTSSPRGFQEETPSTSITVDEKYNSNPCLICPDPSLSELRDLQFAETSFQLFVVKNPVEGVAEYFQLNFDQLHFCACHCTIHTALVDVRVAPNFTGTKPVLPVRLYGNKPPPSLQYSPAEMDTIMPSDNSNLVTSLGETPRGARNDQAGKKDSTCIVSDELASMGASTSNLPTFVEHLADVVSRLQLDGARKPLTHSRASGEKSAVSTGSRKVNEKHRKATASPSSALSAHSGRPTVSIPRLNLGADETDIGMLLLTRCDQVQFITYYHRYLSRNEEACLDWLELDNVLKLPGGIEIPSKANGLPQLKNLLSNPSLSTISFMIPAHLCLDVVEDFISKDGPSSVSGALRKVTVVYSPPSKRMDLSKKLGRGSCLSNELQTLMSHDLGLLWQQIHEAWHKLRVLISLAHREAHFYHEFVWEKRMAARFREIVYLEVHNSMSAAIPIENDLGAVHSQLAEDLRATESGQNLPLMPVEDYHAPFEIPAHPIIFEEKYLSHQDGTSPAFQVMERRNRLASLHGGLAETVPEEISRDILLLTSRSLRNQGSLKGSAYFPCPRTNIDIIGTELLLTARHEREKTELGALAWMSRAENMQVFGTITGRDEEPFPVSTKLHAQSLLLNSKETDEVHGGFHTPRFSSDASEISSDPALKNGMYTTRLNETDRKLLKLKFPVFDRNPNAPKYYEGLHLLVLVHGFQGHPSDMRIIRNQLSILFPEGIYLISAANEDRTDDDIGNLGARLAQEVIQYIKDLCPADTIGRISFIAHSLGGLIVRAALSKLTSFFDRFHLFLTLSSPHLGYLFARNKFVDAGLWLLKKWKRSSSLQQLSMSDAKEIRDTFVYKLSMKTELQHFKHVVFVSSYQDQYAPYESARVEAAERILRDPLWGPIHMDMVRNILSNIKKDRLTRLDVCFKLPDRSIDNLIGRAAHLHFIGSQQLAQSLVYTYPDWFS